MSEEEKTLKEKQEKNRNEFFSEIGIDLLNLDIESDEIEELPKGTLVKLFEDLFAKEKKEEDNNK